MKRTKTALICGISGQDGSFLAQFLLEKEYKVFGTSRDAQGSGFINLNKLGIKQEVNLITMLPEDFRSVLVAFTKANADEIYFLAGQSSVGLSYEQPAETMQSISLGTLNVLEAVRMLENKPKVYFAGSSEIFGNTNGNPANEYTPANPLSPYGVAKASAYWLVSNYRDAYQLFVCTGILFNHESQLRPERFVTQKIVQAAKRISSGSNEILELGRLDISRDWGWSPEYVKAMWLMLQQDTAEDYIIATGETNSLEKFVAKAFEYFNLDWTQHVVQKKELIRPTDILVSVGDASKAKNKLAWKAENKMEEVVKLMLKEQ